MLYKRNSRTFKHLDQKSAVFQGFQGLEKPVMNFKYFQALQGPVPTLPIIADPKSSTPTTKTDVINKEIIITRKDLSHHFLQLNDEMSSENKSQMAAIADTNTKLARISSSYTSLYNEMVSINT